MRIGLKALRSVLRRGGQKQDARCRGQSEHGYQNEVTIAWASCISDITSDA